MPIPISAISHIADLNSPVPLQQTSKPGEFQDLLQGTITNLESIQTEASNAVQKFLSGENQELHTVVLAAQKAELTFDLALQVRNKVVSAYQEIMRMQM